VALVEDEEAEVARRQIVRHKGAPHRLGSAHEDGEGGLGLAPLLLSPIVA